MKRTDTIAVVALLLAAASANGGEIPASDEGVAKKSMSLTTIKENDFAKPLSWRCRGEHFGHRSCVN